MGGWHIIHLTGDIGGKVNALGVVPELIRDVRKFGKFDVGACLNCGSCTIECSLATGQVSFPRKTIRYVHFGLKTLLKASLEPWLCHYCGDCTKVCPREAEPAEAMMTLRKYLISQYDFTGLAARLYSSSAWRIAANLLAGSLVIFLVLFYHLKIVGLGLSDFVTVPMGMEHMFGIISYYTIAIFAIPAVLLILGSMAMHRSAMGRGEPRAPASAYLAELKTLFVQGFTQKRLADYRDQGGWIRHLVLFSGFVLISFLVLFFLRWFQTDALYPLWHPQRWLGYLATLALLYGSIAILVGRVNKREEIHRNSDLGDWILPILILLTALSGIAIHVFRYIGFPLSAHFSFFIHMIFVTPLLVIELPFGKLSHVVYRPLAIYFQAVNERAMKLRAAGEGKDHE
jgi:ferredoxin